MDELLIMLRNVLMFIALALPGFILVKTELIKKEQSEPLAKLLIYIGLPMLIFNGVVNNVTIDGSSMLAIGIVALIGLIYQLATFFATRPLTVMEKNEKTRGMMRFSAAFNNNGFLGIPLAMAVFGGGSPVVTVLIVINIMTNILLYTLGIYLVSGDKSKISWKKAFLNPVLIAFLIGLAVNLIDVKTYVPEIVSFSTHFSNIVTPLSMIVLGMKLGGIKFTSILSSKKLYYVAALKLIVFPIIIVAALIAIKIATGGVIINDSVVLGAFIAFAVPTAGLASTFADCFDGDTDNAVIFTLGTTILSVVTIPVLYWVICVILGSL